MLKKYITYLSLLCLLIAGFSTPVFANEKSLEEDDAKLDIAGMIMGHLGDDYEWHICTIGQTHVTIPLPIIVYGENGFSAFLSSHLHHGAGSYNGYYLAADGAYKGKIVEKNASGQEVRPWDISITKNTLSLMISSVILILLILTTARWYKKNCTPDRPKTPKGFTGFMEMFIMMVNDDIIRPGVGKNYRKFAPYLLTAFFFIFINNLLGLIPIFPGGANLTGNIAITMVLALCTMVAVNLWGTKEYWKEIFWPEVPTWLKVPVPIMPVIEFVGVLTKPFALMIRLFANILAGHSIVLGLMSVIFVAANLGAVLGTSMTVLSAVMTIFMDTLEVLVAFIQAYVFTMLSAVFIGLAQVEPHTAEGHK